MKIEYHIMLEDKLHFNPFTICDNIYKEQVENYGKKLMNRKCGNAEWHL